ncbi:hypothetical protein SAMN04487905_111152 [Actinopolyspora xinjiangensis]|uniref:Uncharacterized protein n=1 Tax=Actinopolyspora xinjiangensis TaxID=405564 RepID=A0A1H0WCA1_9ACTN|nr:hypothetical protein [Actinopolyspora xinjiangensis]SDP87946.1 hypothetical protein SAMN04487905_111152 [Actinopolyspora xinjiangensis]
MSTGNVSRTAPAPCRPETIPAPRGAEPGRGLPIGLVLDLVGLLEQWGYPTTTACECAQHLAEHLTEPTDTTPSTGPAKGGDAA